MDTTISQLTQLPVPDRLVIVQQLWDSIAETKESTPIQDWHRELVKARITEVQGREAELSPTQEQVWDKVAERRGQQTPPSFCRTNSLRQGPLPHRLRA